MIFAGSIFSVTHLICAKRLTWDRWWPSKIKRKTLIYWTTLGSFYTERLFYNSVAMDVYIYLAWCSGTSLSNCTLSDSYKQNDNTFPRILVISIFLLKYFVCSWLCLALHSLISCSSHALVTWIFMNWRIK